MKIDPIRLGLAVGIIWAGGILLLGFLVSCCGWGTVMMLSLASIYRGYDPSAAGVILGTLWALVDGFIAGALVGLLYNLLPKMGEK